MSTINEKEYMSGEVRAAKKRKTFRSVVSALLILVLIPLSIYVGWRMGDKKYYIVSLLIILYTMIPFFMIFEARAPKARELCVIAVLCAIAVAGRVAFIAVPFFKPLVAVVIIAGIAFGSEAGFLCGALSGFVSNFFFGQGPWTPWQMFAYGIAGFICGLLFAKGRIKRERLNICIAGGLVVMLIVGPLLDVCALFTMSDTVDFTKAAALFASGLPVNAVHSAATVFFLFIISRPMLEKLDRIKRKYGMLDDGEEADALFFIPSDN